MLLNDSPSHREHPEFGWLKSLQNKIQGWIRQEIINDDPYDEEYLLAQQLYAQFQQSDQLRLLVPFQSPSDLCASSKLVQKSDCST